MTAPTPHRAASAEERERLRIRLACAICEAHSENPHGRLALIRLRAPYFNWQAKLPIADYLLDTFLDPLLDRITAAEARAEELQGLLVTQEICADKLKAERDNARAALQYEWDAIDLALCEGCGSDSPRAAIVADWIGKCHAADADRDRLADEVARLKQEAGRGN